jgi:uncharacterized protein (TIGR03067 family)
MRITFAIMTLLLVAVHVADAKPIREEKKPDANSLDGVWVCTAVEKEAVGGPDLVGRLKITFAGDKMTLDIPEKGKLESKIVLDLSKQPGHIDMTATIGEKEDTGRGLIIRDRDTLKFCIDNRPGSPRPTEMKGVGSIFVLTLKLQK